MAQAWITTPKPDAFVDSSNNEKSYHSNTHVNYVQGCILFTEGPKAEFREKEDIDIYGFPCSGQTEGTKVLVLLSKVLPGQNLKGFSMSIL